MRTVWLNIVRSSRGFAAARAGNVAITFAFAALGIVAVVGAAIDYSRANSAKAAMQAALDSTALMLAKDAPNLSDGDLDAKALNYFKALFTRPEATGITINATYSTANGSSVLVEGSAEIPTTFLGVLNKPTVAIGGSSVAKWGSTKLRVALVLDNTGSMADAGKMTALKASTKALLTQLKAAAGQNGDVYVSIVPFSKDVNVGSSYYNETWIDWSEWDAANGSSASAFSGSVCISNTLWKVVNNNWTSGGSCTGTGPGICYQSALWKWNGSTFYNAGSCSSGTNHVNWNGCITDRGNSNGPNPNNYDQNVVAASSAAGSKYVAEQYAGCPVAMKPLSYDWTSMNSLVDSMQPNGYTNQGIGLVWGWLTLAGGGVFTVPTKTSGYTYKEVIILLSDGMNTENRWYVSQSPIDKRMYDSSAGGAGTCANIKAAGITIYSIQVNTGSDPLSTVMRNCASSSDKFWMITSAGALGSVFTTIGTNLTQLRVAE